MRHWPWQHHFYYKDAKILGSYYSITGPRVVMYFKCDCGKNYTCTKLGEEREWESLIKNGS